MRNFKTKAASVAGLLVIALAALGLYPGNGPGRVYAQTGLSLADIGGCTNRALNGGYGYFTASGALVGTPTSTGVGSLTPGGFVGRFSFDGNGKVSGLQWGNFNGALSSAPDVSTGTYTVNPDCTGTASLTATNGIIRNYTFVVVKGGNEVLAVAGAANNGFVASQIWERQ
jgi:hypothetical protein